MSDRMTTSLLKRQRYSHWAREALAAIEERSEVVIPFYDWLNPDGSLNEVQFLADQKTKHLKNWGTFHGLIYIHPLKKHYRLGFEREDALDAVARSLKSQIDIAQTLCDPERPYALLVVHLGLATQPDFKAFFRNVMTVMSNIADYADEKKVMISLEPDPVQPYGYTPGTVPNLRNLMPQLYAIAPRRNLQVPFSITFDFAHTYLSFRKDYTTVQRIIRDAADYIYYAHINAPVPRRTPGQTIQQGKKIPQSAFGRWLWDVKNILVTDDGHGSLDRIPAEHQPAFRETMRILARETKLAEGGCVNLEITPVIDRPLEFWRAGATSRGAAQSVTLLSELMR